MGYMNARAMAEATDLVTALEWHLTANCYPPVPREMLPVALEAVELAATEDWDELVTLPNGARHRIYGDAVPAGEIVRALRLEAFVEVQERREE